MGIQVQASARLLAVAEWELSFLPCHWCARIDARQTGCLGIQSRYEHGSSRMPTFAGWARSLGRVRSESAYRGGPCRENCEGDQTAATAIEGWSSRPVSWRAQNERWSLSHLSQRRAFGSGTQWRR